MIIGAARQEQRPAGAGGAVDQAQQPGQQVRGPGVPVDELGIAALGADRRPALLEVEVLDVEVEDLAGSGGGLIWSHLTQLAKGANPSRIAPVLLPTNDQTSPTSVHDATSSSADHSIRMTPDPGRRL